MARHKILVVDDEASVRFGIRNFFEAHGYEVVEAQDCQEAEKALQTTGADVAILDYKLPDGNALDLLFRLRQVDPDVPLIILTAYGSIDLAVHAIKNGAEHFLTKPIELPALLVVIRRVLEYQRTRKKQLASLSGQGRIQIDPFLGTSPAIRQLADHARKVVAAKSPLLILGETGTGKGVLARWLHNCGPRADEAFVDINCAGLSRELLEAELFGHTRGAFTGAVASKSGLLEVAHQGTVFLDEIGDVDAYVQAKLLTVLEEQRFRPLGDVRNRHVDVRLIAATHRDPLLLVQKGGLRSDLYFRISTIALTTPPLRARAEDIPLLARHLLAKCAADIGHGPVSLSPAAERTLQAYCWPGNIRELRNVLERAVLLSRRSLLGPEDLRFDVLPVTETGVDHLNLTLQDLEQRHIFRVLQAEKGHVAQAARRLGIPRSSLYQKIKRYSIELSEF